VVTHFSVVCCGLFLSEYDVALGVWCASGRRYSVSRVRSFALAQKGEWHAHSVLFRTYL